MSVRSDEFSDEQGFRLCIFSSREIIFCETLYGAASELLLCCVVDGGSGKGRGNGLEMIFVENASLDDVMRCLMGSLHDVLIHVDVRLLCQSPISIQHSIGMLVGCYGCKGCIIGSTVCSSSPRLFLAGNTRLYESFSYERG
jgi:hypothetical protein